MWLKASFWCEVDRSTPPLVFGWPIRAWLRCSDKINPHPAKKSVQSNTYGIENQTRMAKYYTTTHVHPFSWDVVASVNTFVSIFRIAVSAGWLIHSKRKLLIQLRLHKICTKQSLLLRKADDKGINDSSNQYLWTVPVWSLVCLSAVFVHCTLGLKKFAKSKAW